jgi:hypothetical protein
MGYPMTWIRIILRNGLIDGNYVDSPTHWAVNCNMSKESDATMGAVRREYLERFDHKIKMLTGDVRRLEEDVTDEAAICQRIADKLKMNKDDVAAVLLEFMRI